MADRQPIDRPAGHATGADAEHQEWADFDQATSDRDQAAADADQAASDSDQAASDSDQAAADRERVPGDASARDEAPAPTSEIRDRNTQRREETARGRVGSAGARDEIARQRDALAAARDEAAARRDAVLTAREAAWINEKHPLTGAEIVLRAAANRKRAAADRAAAAEFRAQAAADRAQAARDRDQAAHDRVAAAADRAALLHQLAIAETDTLTGVRTRGAGLSDLDLEISRARRTTGSLVAAYIDVVGLKQVNDTHGHSAGDALLRRIVDVIRCQLRPYDLIVRLGGDEFLGVMSGATLQEARARFETVCDILATGTDPCEIKVGYASLEPQDGVDELIERADADLPRTSRGVVQPIRAGTDPGPANASSSISTRSRPAPLAR